MPKPLIFISCGQVFDYERQLGTEICKIVQAAGFDGFFAQTQSTLVGLNENILGALGRCAGFVFVMHPRGTVNDNGGNRWQRGSVWIEQEVAIAAFLQSTGQDIRVAAYVHESIRREGVRDLLHLNPVLFKRTEEVLTDLRTRILDWRIRKDFEVLLTSSPGQYWQGLRSFVLGLGVKINKRANRYTLEVSVPAAALSHNSATYALEVVERRTSTHRLFRMTEKEKRVELFPGENKNMMTIDYAFNHLKDFSEALDQHLTASAYTDDQSDEITTTLREVGGHS